MPFTATTHYEISAHSINARKKNLPRGVRVRVVFRIAKIELSLEQFMNDF